MRSNLLVSLGVSLLVFAAISIRPQSTYGQQNATNRACEDVPGETSGTYKFRLGETLHIPLTGDEVPASVRDCDPVELRLHWANGRNNGAMFNVTLLDDNRHPIHARQLAGFLPGAVSFPLASITTHPGNGASLSLMSMPASVTIQAGEPFSAPAVLSFVVTRVARPAKSRAKGEEGNVVKGNEVVSIRNVERLIGTGRIPLVQIELKTARAFPVKDVPLQLQIGSRVFIEELSGEYTGRKLILSLTPEMFAELKDGDEIVGSFGKPDGADKNVWSFGKLSKDKRLEQ